MVYLRKCAILLQSSIETVIRFGRENSFPGVLGNVVSGRIASHLNLGGTNCVIDAACASALGAVKMAADALLTGTCDMAITGGVDTENNIFMYMCFSKTPAFSKKARVDLLMPLVMEF